MASQTFNKETSTYHSDRANRQFFGNQGGRNRDPRFRLKVPDSQKTKDWYIDYVNYIVPARASTIDDYEEMLTNYEIYNGNVDRLKEQFDHFCRPLGESFNNDIGEVMSAYPVLHTKVNVLKGELIKRNDNHKVLLLSAKAIKEKNKEFFEKLKQSVEKEIQLEMVRQEKLMSGMNPAEIEQYVEQLRNDATPEDILRKDFLSDTEIFYNAVLKEANYSQQIPLKKMDTFTDVINADRCFIYVGFKNGKPYMEVKNPLRVGFRKGSDERFIHKSDYIYHKTPITIANAIQEYENYLTDDEIMRLGIYTSDSNNAVDKRHDVKSGLAIPTFDHTTEELFRDVDLRPHDTYEDKNLGLSTGQGVNHRYNRNDLIWETHIEFKAFTEIDFLSYKDDYNKMVTIEVKNFNIPEDAEKVKFTNRWGEESFKYVWFDDIMETEYELERLWIPRKYEVVRLGEDVYPIYREVPYQVTNIDDPYGSFELSTKGAIFTARNAKSVSLVQRAVPLYMQYLYLKHILNRELSKYRGYIMNVDVDQIPDDLGKDSEGNVIQDAVSAWLATLQKTNMNLYSGSQSGISGEMNYQRAPGSTGFTLGVATELYNLQLMVDFVSREIGMTMGISPEREAMFSKGSNVTDNQQAIVQSHHITEPYFFLHSEIWRAALNEYLINYRNYVKRIFEQNPDMKEHNLNYILPDGTKELLSVTPNMLTHIGIGLVTSNGGNDEKYRQFMEQSIHAFSQNAGEGMEAVSSLAKAISMGSSPEDTHRLIQIESDKQKKRQEELMKREQEIQQAALAAQEREKDKENNSKIEQIQAKGVEDRLTKITPSGDDNDNDIEMQEEKLELDRDKHQETVRNNKANEEIQRERNDISRKTKNQKK